VSELSVVEPLQALGARMRAEGARVGVAELLAAHRALDAVDPASREDGRMALRAVMCGGREDLARFDRAFQAVFGSLSREPVARPPLAELGAIERAALPHAAIPGSAPGPSPDPGSSPVPAAYSSVELLRDVDFAVFDDAQVALAERFLQSLARRGPSRLSRRTRPDPRRGHAPDLRRIVRSSLRTGGEPVQRHWRAPSRRPRPVVLMCDVSGSMSPYARMLLRYLHACVAAHRRVEAFAFGTRLTRITYELSRRDPAAALDRATDAVVDYAGGTRIGAAVGELNRVHGRLVGRGAVVVILSDGWDRGDPDELAVELGRLRRTAHRLIWLNPLAAHVDYEPLTRGMRTAVPHTDELIAGNSLASLERLAEILEAL
jgi:uncharacterized protein with von Willebrand factor type A (vWA) domain